MFPVENLPRFAGAVNDLDQLAQLVKDRAARDTGRGGLDDFSRLVVPVKALEIARGPFGGLAQCGAA